MAFMMAFDVKYIEFQDDMTIQFIVVVAINILYFVVQMVPGLILNLCNIPIQKKKNKEVAEKLKLKISNARIYKRKKIDRETMFLPKDMKKWKRTHPWLQ